MRAKFLIECLNDLKKNLLSKGLDLLVRHGKPEDIIPPLAKACRAHTVSVPVSVYPFSLSLKHVL